MKSIESKRINIAVCPYCDEFIWLEDSDFLLLNNERICFYTCNCCGMNIKITKEEEYENC